MLGPRMIANLAAASGASAPPLLDWSTDATAARALEATYWDPVARAFEVFGVDTARVLADDFLYVEGERRNEYPDYAGGFSAVDATITNNAINGPDGAANGDYFTAIANDGRVFRLNISVAGAGQYTASAFHQYRAGDAFGRIYTIDGPITVFYFEAFTAQASEWNRVDVQAASTGSGTTSMGIQENGAGDNASIYYQGMQFEAGDFPSQLIRTSGVPVTRPADDIVVAAADVPTVMRTGSWSVAVRPARASTEAGDENSETLFAFATGTDDRIYFDALTNQVRVRQGGVTRVSSNVLTWSRGQEMVLDFDAAAGSIAVTGATSGDGEVVDMAWAMPFDDLQVGNIYGLNRPFFGAIGQPLGTPDSGTFLLDYSSDLTFARASVATYWDIATRTYTEYALNEARILPGGDLFVEGERTNYHDDYDQRSSHSSAFSYLDAATAPNGEATADRIDSAGTNGNFLYGSFSVPSGGDYTASIFFQRNVGGVDTGSLRLNSGVFTSEEVFITSDVDQWKRDSVTSVASGSGLGNFYFWSNSSSADYDLWGAQVEGGDFPSQTIATAGADATRSADDAVVASANVPAAMLAGGWSFTIKPERASTDTPDSGETLFAFGGGSSADRIFIVSNRIRVIVGGVQQVQSSTLTWSRNQKLTVTIDAAAGSIEVSGATTGDGTVVGTSWTMPAGDMQVGNTGTLTTPFFGAIGRPEAV